MNKTNILLTTLVVLMIVLLFGCEKDDINPTKSAAFGKLEIVHGDNQSGYFGELLSDSIVIKASSYNVHKRYLVEYEMIKGNGGVERGNYYVNDFSVDSTGIFEIKWRLGCDFELQEIKLLLYVDSTKNEYGYLDYYSAPSDSIIIRANGSIPNGWGRSCGSESLDTYSSKIISFDDNTLYPVSHGLYSSTDEGINWYQVEGVPEWVDIVDAQFNSLGWLYVLTNDHGICYSKDLQYWEFINNGILDHRDPTTFFVEDSTIFVSFYFDGPYKTSNNGGFWRKMLVGGNAQRFYNITRHPNGDIYLVDDWSDLWISKNFGYTWEEVEIEYKYVYSSVFDLEIDGTGNIYIGANDARISKVSADTYEGEIHDFYEMNHSSQQVEDIRIINNTVYFTVNGNPTPGIYSSQNWQKLELGFEGSVSNYYLKKDGTFLLLSIDGLFYYNE